MPLKRLGCAWAALLLMCCSAFAQNTGDRLSAEELIRSALRTNQEYLAAQERVREAEVLVRQAGLRPGPTIEVEAATGKLLGSRGESEYSAGYFHTIELGDKRAKRVAAAEKAVAVAGAELSERARQIAFEVKNRYIAAVTAELKLGTIRELQPVTEENYRLTVSRVELGDAAPLEQQLLLTEMNSAEARVAFLSAARQAALVELRAAASISAGGPEEVILDFPLAAPTLDLPALKQQALERRGDLQILTLLEEQRLAETELARAGGRPDITGSLRYTHSRSSFDQSGFSDAGTIVPLRDADNVLTFGVSIPLFTQKPSSAAVDAAQSRQNQQRLQRERLSMLIPQEVEAAYLRWSGAMRALDILRNGVLDPSQRNLTVIRGAYRLGQLRLLDVLNEQRRLVDLQMSFVDAQAEAARALAELERAVGGILP